MHVDHHLFCLLFFAVTMVFTTPLPDRQDLMKSLRTFAKEAASQVSLEFSSPSRRGQRTGFAASVAAAAACLRRAQNGGSRTVAIPSARNESAFTTAQLNELLPFHELRRTEKTLALFRKLSMSVISRRTFGGSLGALPAIVHQTWKTDCMINCTDGWDKRIDEWDDDEWAHLVWTDEILDSVVRSVFPWLSRTLRELPSSKLIRRVDTMRYAVVLLLGGLYLDADDMRWGGDLRKVALILIFCLIIQEPKCC